MIHLTTMIAGRCSNRALATTVARTSSTMTTSPGDRDIFGTLSDKGTKQLNVHMAEKLLPEDPDGYDQESFDLAPRKNAYYYKYEISKYARQGAPGLRKALELFNTMKSKDRLTPSVNNFSPLIYGCAKAGFTKKAFELYDESLKYHMKPTASTVTSLINACAESPFPEYGLARLDWFLDHLKIDQDYQMNLIQFNSAVKAYGKLGQLERASGMVRDMIAAGLAPDTVTFNMLLVGCASYKESGTLLAFKIYKRLKYFGLKPDIFTYRLFLRCIRDCGLSSAEQFKLAFEELPAMTSFEQRFLYKKAKRKSSNERDNFEWLPLISDLGKSISSAISISTKKGQVASTGQIVTKESMESGLVELSQRDSNLALAVSSDSLPNLLSDDHLDLACRIEAINFDRINRPQDRLMLFGGMSGFLETMKNDDCPPDNKLFSLLLDCIPHVPEIQSQYYELSKKYAIKKDLVFYDLLIRHVTTNYKDTTRLKRAFKILDEMQSDSIRPNISTFESLASACDSFGQAKKLISDIKLCGFTLSDSILENLFRCASFKKDFLYLIGLIQLSMDLKFSPKRVLVDSLEKMRLECRDTINLYERQQLTDKQKYDWLTEEQIEHFDNFNQILGKWLNMVKVTHEDHPWAQFDVDSPSKRDGFIKFAKNMKVLHRVKHEAMTLGGSKNLGNLTAKAEHYKAKMLAGSEA